MKIRSGFVSNSSSASFVIPLAWISQELVDKFFDRCRPSWEDSDEYRKRGWRVMETGEDCWSIHISHGEGGRDALCGETLMDNGGMRAVFMELGFPEDCAIWESDG